MTTSSQVFCSYFGLWGCVYLADSVFYPLCIIVGHFDQMIRLNTVKLQGGDQNSPLQEKISSAFKSV